MLLSEQTAIEKGSYFRNGDALFYVVDVLLENQYVILENCYTEAKVMVTQSEFDGMVEAVVVPSNATA